MEHEVKYAGFWIRVLANILDCIFLAAIMFLVRFFFPTEAVIPGIVNLAEIQDFSQFSSVFAHIWESIITVNMVNIIVFIGFLAYPLIMVGQFGATLGKMAVGIRIVREDLRPVSYGTAFIREILIKEILFVIILFVSWLGYLWVSWDRRKQGWHDKIARTLVIREGKMVVPVKPVNPVIPVEPVKPVEPAKPAEPVEQIKPIEKPEVVEPSKTAGPAEPLKSAAEKSEQEKLAEWTKQIESAAKNKPAEPAKPPDSTKKVVPFGN